MNMVAAAFKDKLHIRLASAEEHGDGGGHNCKAEDVD